MGKKIYFWGILLFTLFTHYWQFVVVGTFPLVTIILFIRDVILILAGFSVYFNKPLFDTHKWQLTYKFLLVITAGTFIYQILPTSFFGDFSLLNSSLLTNILVYILLLSFYIPLYFAVYQLTKLKKTSKRKK